MNSTTLITHTSEGYELIDSGEREKLERFGDKVLRRPDPQALWKKSNPSLWDNADYVFKKGLGKTGSWKKKEGMPEEWPVTIEGVTLIAKPTPFKHTGIFPEQAPNWAWLKETVKIASKEVSVLNLFGYTGAASIACAQAGAKVTHIDASKGVVTWAHQNAQANNLDEQAIRWIVDDAIKFVAKEIRRGKKYDGIIMDPPAFGGETWKLEESLVGFIEECKQLLSKEPIFFLVNGYASGYSSTTYVNNIQDLQATYGGTLEHGELTIEASSDKKLLPAGIFARWKK